MVCLVAIVPLLTGCSSLIARSECRVDEFYVGTKRSAEWADENLVLDPHFIAFWVLDFVSSTALDTLCLPADILLVSRGSKRSRGPTLDGESGSHGGHDDSPAPANAEANNG